MFQIFNPQNKKELDSVMNYLNVSANAIYDARKVEVLLALENDLQKTIFLDWWNGGHLWKWNKETKQHDRADRYQHINEHDWEIARGYIMETISLGMG